MKKHWAYIHYDKLYFLLILIIFGLFLYSIKGILYSESSNIPKNTQNIILQETSLKCDDGTSYGKCSKNKPLFCLNGTLINKSRSCGCSSDQVIEGENCLSKFEANPKDINFQYMLMGETNEIQFIVYKGLSDYLSRLPRYYYCDPDCPTELELELEFINEEIQEEYLVELVEKIKLQTNNKDEQARIAISLVQTMPYDVGGYLYDELATNKYPYEVLYDQDGLCGEKARLLAFLLRELDFEVVFFLFEFENHMALGIKCPNQYSYKNTGYCFIETTRPTIITYVPVYEGGVALTSHQLLKINEGISFDSVLEEYNDALELKRLDEEAELNNNYLNEYDYNLWESLVNKYGLDIAPESNIIYSYE